MLRTLSGWWSNATSQLELMWTEPLSYAVVGLAFVIGFRLLAHRPRAWQRAAAIVAGSVWLVATLAMTVYPIEYLQAPSRDRFELQSIVPFAGLIDAIADSGGYEMTPEQYEAHRRRLAEEFGIPIEDVVSDPFVRGPGLAAVMKDPIGNVVLFVPLGVLAPLASPALRRGARVFALGAGISLCIELSQALFGLGSLGTIDDVIANAGGALLGYVVYGRSRVALSRLREQRLAGSAVGGTA